MFIHDDIASLHEHTTWSGAKYNYDLIIKSGNAEKFISYLEEITPPEEIEIKNEYWED